MPQVRTEDAILNVEVDGEGEPVTVLAHGLTNNCKELAAFTPFVPGTKVRFDFRGHGRSTAPATVFGFADFARDLDAVASAYGATRAVGTSLGAGAIANLLCRDPGRFERTVWLMPAALDGAFAFKERYRRLAADLEGKTADEALQVVLSDPGRVAEYLREPWREDLDRVMWAHADPDGLAHAIRGVIEDWPVDDRELLRRIQAPVLLICIEGDEVHAVELGRLLAELLPNAELLVYGGERALLEALPELVQRVAVFLAG